ncbi:MAG TPA: type II toxin-antitoxin system VapC family toxin [Vicinamibacterales bacterium]|nr:type II toxin-antitoxin system VapC family toxin [Vicinamibacterales bacterium]
MTIDTSAMVAVLFAESGHLDLLDQMLAADVLRIGAPTLVETSLVFEGRRGKPAGRLLEDLVGELGITVIPFGENEWRRAAAAFSKYGRGRHKASLNFGDCLAYATAAIAGDTLLFVGGDFRHTDIAAAM